ARVSIFNESVHNKHPLLGLKFKNVSKQALMQGPLTVFEDDQWAGDSRILDLQPGEERLVSYAIDLGTEGVTEDRLAPGPEMAVRINSGHLQVQYKLRTTRSYVVKNRSPQDRTVVIEQPVRSGWKLVDPAKPSERTRDVYRFEVAVKAGEEKKFEVA